MHFQSSPALTAGIVCLFALGGCTSDSAPQKPAAAAETLKPALSEQAADQEIGRLEGRNHTIYIRSTSNGPRMTVRSKDGGVLDENLSPDQLSARYPQLYELYEAYSEKEKGHLDASIHVAPSSHEPAEQVGKSFVQPMPMQSIDIDY